MSIEDGFCTLAELADGMAAAVVTKYARPPGEVFTWQDSDGELDSMDTSENIRIVSRQNAVLEIFRLIDQGEITPLNMSFMQAAQPVPYEYFDRRIIRREQAAQILQRMFGTTPAPQPQAAAPAPVVAESASNGPTMKPKAKPRTWRDVSSAYIVEVMQAGQYATCKALYRALEAKAGSNAPFDKGTGDNRGRLYVREIARPLSLKTVQNNWAALQELAKK